MQHPFPSGPECLPLYPDADGCYSVNGPALRVNHSEHPTSHLLDSQISNPACQSPYVPPHLHQHCIVTTDELVIPSWTSEFSPPTPVLASSFYSQQSPQTFLQRKYVCNEQGCTWRSPFKTKQGLTLLQVTGDHSALSYFFSYTFPISLTIVISFLCH